MSRKLAGLGMVDFGVVVQGKIIQLAWAQPSKETASWRPRHAPRHVRRARAEMRSRNSRRMRNPQYYVSEKKPIEDP